MKKEVVVWIVVFGLFVLHWVLHVGFRIGTGAPDLLTVGLLLGAREVGMGRASGLGLFFGLLEDAMNILSFGANSVAMTLIGALGAITRDLFVGDSLVFLVSYFVLGKWIRDFVLWTMMGESLRGPFLDQVVLQGFLGGLYAAGVGVIVMAFTGLWREAPA